MADSLDDKHLVLDSRAGQSFDLDIASCTRLGVAVCYPWTDGDIYSKSAAILANDRQS